MGTNAKLTIKQRLENFKAMEKEDKRRWWGEFFIDNSLYIFLIAAIIGIAVYNPNFVSMKSIINIVSLSAANLPIALGIAAAILTDAPYLILDEPLNGLDPEGIQWVRDFIKDYVSDHRTVIVSSHYMAELELVTDHVVGLSNGRKVLDGGIAALLDQYGSLEQAYFYVVKK